MSVYYNSKLKVYMHRYSTIPKQDYKIKFYQKKSIMRNIFLLTFILISLFIRAQDDVLIENTWYLQKVIINGNEYVTPINEEVGEVAAYFYNNSFATIICNNFGGSIHYHSSEQSFTLSDVSITLMDCELPDNHNYEMLYFWQFFHNGLQLVQPYSYSIEDVGDYFMLTLTNSEGFQAVYHTQNTVSVSKLAGVNGKFRIYPNPVINKLFIQGLNDKETLSVNITNLLGQQIMNEVLSDGQNELDVSRMDKGVYLVRIFGEDGIIVHTEKIIKE